MPFAGLDLLYCGPIETDRRTGGWQAKRKEARDKFCKTKEREKKNRENGGARSVRVRVLRLGARHVVQVVRQLAGLAAGQVIVPLRRLRHLRRLRLQRFLNAKQQKERTNIGQ